MIWVLELSEIQGTVTSAAPVALLEEEGTKRESFSFCSSRQVLGLTHKFPSESPTECHRSPGPEDAEAEHPTQTSDRKCGWAYSSSWGARLPIAACNAWREITRKNNDYHSWLQFRQERKIKDEGSRMTKHRINSDVHLDRPQPNTADRPIVMTRRGVG